jgi:hypothetical protein
MRKIILSTFIALISLVSYSQTKETTFGIGTGMDYGGIGVNLLHYPQKNIGLFGGFGYNLVGLGYNAGVKIRLVNEKHAVSPYIMGMYGYNAVIKVKGATGLNKTFYGPTLGLGLDYKSSPSQDHYWTFALLIPIRGSEVDNYMTDLENNYGVQFQNKLTPIGFSIGYRFIVD